MCASPLSLFRASPPPPKVVLLPDALFFTRSVRVSATASAAEIAAQVELALEAVSPFPLAQLYYGWFSNAGAEQALVFAAYRRRFTAEQTAAWEGAELVLPTFAALAAADVQPATTLVLTAAEGLTAVHWEAPNVPAKVLFRALPVEAGEEERVRVREDLVRAVGGSKAVIDLATPPAADSAASDRELVFRSGEILSRLPVMTAGALDVRDKGELTALRAAQKRDVMLWRVLLGSAALFLLLVVGELALIGGRSWQTMRTRLVAAQKPRVEKIMTSQALAFRIEELATKRLLPFEMLTIMISENRRPQEITFSNVRASVGTGINSLTVEAVSTNAAQVSLYPATLKKLPAVENAEARITGTRGDTANFTLVVTFKPDALKPADSISQ